MKTPSPRRIPDEDDAPGELRVRGRGTPLDPPNRFDPISLHVLREHVQEVLTEHPDGIRRPTFVLADATKTIVNPVESPDLPFEWSLNPYRGCEHGCVYCYARPTHEYLSMSSGLDFETRILAKFNAASLLEAHLRRPQWKGEWIMMSGVTDPYQPVERELRITRSVIDVCLRFRQPLAIITKNRLLERDLDLLAGLNAFGAVRCAVSITTLDPRLAASMEPRASSPAARLDLIKSLKLAGIPTTVMVAPLIPGINDHELANILHAAADAGATSAGFVMLRLPYQVKDIFLNWLRTNFHERAAKVESLIRDVREGELNCSEYFVRWKGSGPRAAQIAATFKLFCRRAGLLAPSGRFNGVSPFCVPRGQGDQLPLFGGD